MPLLSIIIPVYNVEKYLDEGLLSILHQDFKDFEIILVNDASKDNSGKICDDYALKYDNVKAIHLEVNSLLGVARNVGLQHASGRYIHFCDSDDYYVSGSLSRVADVLITKAPTVLIGQFVCKAEKGAFSFTDVTLDPIVFESNDREQIVNYLFGVPNLLGTAWRVITKHEFLMSEQLTFIKGFYAEDEEWFPKVICSADSFALVTEPYYVYRPRASGSITSTKTYLHSKSHLAVILSLLNFVHKKNYDNSRTEYIFSRVKFLLGLFATRIDSFSRQELHEMAEMIEREIDSVPLLDVRVKPNDLFDFIRRYGIFMGLCLYRTFVMESTLHMVYGHEDKEIYIFPTGYNGEGSARIIRNAGYNVKGFLDNGLSKNGLEVDGLLVSHPAILKECSEEQLSQIFVLVTIQREQTAIVLMNQLKELGLADTQYASRIY